MADASIHKAIPGVMSKFRIGEVSGVTIPAQAPALAAIRKNAGGSGQDEGVVMSAALKKALGLAEDADDAAIEKALTDTLGRVASMSSELALAKAVGSLSDQERAYVKAKAMGDEETKAFAAKPQAERDAMCKAHFAEDETLVVKGHTIRKSEVGAGMFGILKAQQEELQAQAVDYAKRDAELRKAGFAKRAADEFSHLAGTVDERALVLEHLSKGNAEVQAAGEAMLKAAEANSVLAFSKLGSGAGGGGLPGGMTKAAAKAAWDAKVSEVQKRDKSLLHIAMSKAATEFPEVFEAFQEATSAPVQ